MSACCPWWFVGDGGKRATQVSEQFKPYAVACIMERACAAPSMRMAMHGSMSLARTEDQTMMQFA
jgi:hypothetical protein